MHIDVSSGGGNVYRFHICYCVKKDAIFKMRGKTKIK